MKNQLGLQIIVCNTHRMSIYWGTLCNGLGSPVSEKSNGLANNNMQYESDVNILSSSLVAMVLGGERTFGSKLQQIATVP